MREIIFRGKRKDNGEWVEGWYSCITKGAYLNPIINGHYITTFKNLDNGEIILTGMYEVIPETVGQYTGLKDKNGNMIFEGDIVKSQIVINQRFKVIFEKGSFLFDNSYIKANARDIFSLEVFGNTHDNPELIKEA